jgi:hypothetical protein
MVQGLIERRDEIAGAARPLRQGGSEGGEAASDGLGCGRQETGELRGVVDVSRSGLHAQGESHAAFSIARDDSTGEAVSGFFRDPQRFGFTIDFEDRRDRAEHLVLGDHHPKL